MEASTETRTDLSPVELAAWGGFLRATGAIIRDLDAELTAQHGITLSDYEVLLFLAHAPQRRLRMSDLAASVLISQSGITRLVDRLQGRGLIAREQCPEDRRGSFAVLTDAGLSKLRESSVTHLRGVRERFLTRLDPDAQQVLGELWEQVLPGTAEALRPLARRSG